MERACLSQSIRLILAGGIVLRVALTVLTPADKAYDNHVEPVQKILSTGRIPDAADCWECYQPPVYYVLSAGAWAVAQWGALGLGAPAATAEALGRKMLQWVSCAAGVGVLLLSRRILRRCGVRGGPQAAALALICFLPSHIRMSAMATNDALTYFIATAAVLAALWAARRAWALWPCVACGSLAGLAVCTKAYGAVSVAAIVAAIAVARLVAPGAAGRAAGDGIAAPLPKGYLRRLLTALRPAGVVLGAALLTGSGPAIRNLLTFGRPHVDNFDFFDTPMRFQPPGSAAAIDFRSFRFAALLHSPWLHTSHLDSFWAEMYGRLWFDYEGFHSSLSGHPGWEAHWKACAAAHPRWSRKRWEMLLAYGPEDVPPHFAWLGRLQYVAGLPLTALVLLGLLRGSWITLAASGLALRALLLREARSAPVSAAARSIPTRGAAQTEPPTPAHRPRRAAIRFATVLLTLHFWAAACVPLFQSLRLPHFAAMKEAFALSALASIAVAAAWGLRCAGRRSASVPAIAAGALALVVGVAQGAYVLLIAMRAPAP